METKKLTRKRECRKEYSKEYYQKNRIKKLENSKKYRQNNYDKIKERRKEYNLKNKDVRKEYYQKNKKRIKEKSKKYYQKNKKIMIKRNRIYRRKYLRNNPNARISARLRCRLHNALKYYTKNGKHQSSKKYGLNYGKIIDNLKPFPKDLSKYHIDHIIPLCNFNLTNPEEIKIAFAPENHQWLLAKDNLSKGGKWI